MVLPDPSKFVSRVRFSHAAPFIERTNNDYWECRNVFGMCNFIELWYHSAGGSSTVDQQLVASLLERLALESAREHAIYTLCRSWQNSRTSFRPEVIPTPWRFRFHLHFQSKTLTPIGEMVSLLVWDQGAQVRFLHRRPCNATVAEWPNAWDCKSQKPSVRIWPVAPSIQEDDAVALVPRLALKTRFS